MIKQMILCVLCLMLLSACDTGGNPSGATVNSVSGETYIPIDLETATETTSGMIMSGAIDHNTGDVDAFWIRADRGLDAYRNIEVETRNGYLLRLTHQAGLTDGTYPINATLDSDLSETDIAGGVLYLWSPDESQQFTQNPQGTITIQIDDLETFGTFSITLENDSGEQVMIEGQFFAEESGSAVG